MSVQQFLGIPGKLSRRTTCEDPRMSVQQFLGIPGKTVTEDDMRKSRFTEAQIIGILKQAEGGARVADLAREHGVSSATIYGWRSKFGGMEVSDAKRLKELEEQNRELKQMVADLSLDNRALKSVLGKKW